MLGLGKGYPPVVNSNFSNGGFSSETHRNERRSFHELMEIIG